MNIEVITSVSEDYYNRIGKESIESWLKYWPENLTLTCYVEGFSLPFHPRIRQISFEEFDQDYTKFQEADYTTQVKKFSKKAFSFIHAMEHSTADKVVWLDADVITNKELPLSVLTSVLPNNVLSTHMGVTYWTTKEGEAGRWFVPETGFFAVNKLHPSFDKFCKEYRRRYVEGDLVGLRRFYDNDVYGVVFEQMGAGGYDLCADLKKEYKTPLKHTVLGEYLHHFKAKHSKAEFVINKTTT
jgi:hypothetical protein